MRLIAFQGVLRWLLRHQLDFGGTPPAVGWSSVLGQNDLKPPLMRKTTALASVKDHHIFRRKNVIPSKTSSNN
jgi:hypothetical protein